MRISKKGVTRIVFVFGVFVIKIPRFTYSHHHFLQGCSNNWTERLSTKQWGSCNDWGSGPNLYELIAPTYFCSWFGLVQIQARCEEIDFEPDDNTKKTFYPVCRNDTNGNIGRYKGRMVCFDYN